MATQDARRSFVSAVAIRDGRFVAVGTDADIMAYRGDRTQMIDVGGRTVIPASTIHTCTRFAAGSTTRWNCAGMACPRWRMRCACCARKRNRTPPPQWVRVVGGWTEFQFAERRLPTLDEINAVAPDTPVFVLHLYDRALLNGAALRAVGYTKDTPDPPGGAIQRDRQGNPTGLLDRQTQRPAPLCHAGQRAEACARGADGLDAPLYARTQPLRPHQRH